MPSPQTACLDPDVKQKVTWETDVPDRLRACDEGSSPASTAVEGALTSGAGGLTRRKASRQQSSGEPREKCIPPECRAHVAWG